MADQLSATIRQAQLLHRILVMSDYLTISIGVASLRCSKSDLRPSQSQQSPSNLIHYADQALYQAKLDVCL